MTETCKAAWNGGKCTNDPDAARELCHGHYGQWRRQTDTGKRDVRVVYTPLRVAGDAEARTVPVTVHLQRHVADDYKRLADDTGKGLSELLRPWLEAGYKREQDRKERRRLPPPISG